MGVIDDLKDSVPGTGKHDSSGSHNSSSRSGRNSSRGNDTGFGDSDFDGSFSDSPDLGSDSSPSQKQSQQPGNSRQGSRGNVQRGQSQGSRGRNDTRRAHQAGQRGNSGQQPQRDSFDTPNAQAGRPQEGSSQPQLSSQTQKKMDNAGLEPANQNQGRSDPLEQDFEELKRQNEQIIELLKRINQNLQRR